MQKRLTSGDGFRAGLKRRGGTDARIDIFKNVFVGNPCRAKGFAARAVAVGWPVLAHNLWVLAPPKFRQAAAAAKAA